MTLQRILVALTAAGTSALSIGLLPHPWDGVVVVAIAGIGTLYETPKEKP
jgi:hypothetical protein